MGERPNERQARELAPLRDNAEAMGEAWQGSHRLAHLGARAPRGGVAYRGDPDRPRASPQLRLQAPDALTNSRMRESLSRVALNLIPSLLFRQRPN